MSSISQVEIDVSQISYALEHSENFFLNFFLADIVSESSPVPDFHIDIFKRMCTSKHPYFCCAVPRGHAKTTLAKLAAIWYWLFTDTEFIVYISNTSEVAIAGANDIIGFLESDNFKAYHYNICGRDIEFSVRQEGKGFYRFTLFPGHELQKSCTIKSLGAGKQVRGLNIGNLRPQVAIVDDLEVNDGVSVLEEENAYKKLKKWFYGPFRKALANKHKIIQLGNMVAFQCLVKDHTESKFWDSMRYGCILKNGKPLWPELWSLEALALDFEQYVEQGMTNTWFAEMMNMPIAEGMGLLKADDITYLPARQPDECEFNFITVDPAISKKKTGHKAALVVYGYVEPYWQIVEDYADRGMDPLRLFDKIIELCYRWNVNVVGIESVAYQSSLKYVFTHLCLIRHIESLSFVDLDAVNRKPERLAAWASEIKAKNIALTEGDVFITQQALFYDPSSDKNDDDTIDAAAYAPQMIARYMYLIMQSYKGKVMPDNVPLEDFAEV